MQAEGDHRLARIATGRDVLVGDPGVQMEATEDGMKGDVCQNVLGHVGDSVGGRGMWGCHCRDVWGLLVVRQYVSVEAGGM